MSLTLAPARRRAASPALLLVLLFASPRLARPAGIDPALLSGLRARSIGPAGMSGRVTAIAAVESDPETVYVGAAAGGVWKSRNGGLTWQALFDDQPVASIGALAVFQANPDVVWVGTGEANIRNNVSVGDGVYRSLDGGRTWAHLGLAGSEHIARIVLHPTNPDVAWVAALGRAWGDDPERGVFLTENGGKSWQKVLYADEGTGAADLVLDPRNPLKLFASLWQFRRRPWSLESGGPGSGLFASHDGGRSWRRLTAADGLPAGDLGRIKLAISRSNPEVVYAMVEAKVSALLRSEDGGVHWAQVDQGPNLFLRPFYFGEMKVDPQWPNRLYNLDFTLNVSNDSGKTFRPLFAGQKVHPDFHALWIDPGDPRRLYIGDDGGFAVSRDRGRTAEAAANLPLAQLNRVAVDLDVPYHVYGGMQDNGSWRGPSSAWEEGGVHDQAWTMVGRDDGVCALPEPGRSTAGLAMAQNGGLQRWDLLAGEVSDLQVAAPAGVKLRFDWTAGLARDPLAPDTVYLGSQFLHRSQDGGRSWTVVSPDLTRNGPEWKLADESGGLTPDVGGAETFAAITAVAPSPRARGLIWVGTDDGRIQVTRDGGASWTSVEGSLPGVPPGARVPQIRPSKFDPCRAFVVLDDHRRSNWTPYLYRTDDCGKSWKSLAAPAVHGYALAVEEDPVDRDLLFLGTEFGLWVSLDGGGRWLSWRHGLPTVAVSDLVVHPREHDLVIATHGRGFFVLDDVGPLRALSSAVLAEPLHLFAIPDAQEHAAWPSAGGAGSHGAGTFRGEDRPYGALITFAVAPAVAVAEEEAEVRVTDASGQAVRTFHADVHPGVNRAAWGLERNAFRLSPRGPRPPDPAGPEVLPGVYTVVVKVGDHEAAATVRVLADPRSPYSPADGQARWAAVLAAGRLQDLAVDGIDRIQKTRADVESVAARSSGSPRGARSLPPAAARLEEKLATLERRLWRPNGTPIGRARTDLQSRVFEVVDALPGGQQPPSPGLLEELRQAEEELDRFLADLDRFLAEDVAAFRRLAAEAGVELLPPLPPLRQPRP